MSENKPCPVCRSNPPLHEHDSGGDLLTCRNEACLLAGYWFPLDAWNAPRHYEQEIERLRARIKDLAMLLSNAMASGAMDPEDYAEARALLAKGDVRYD